MDTPSMAGGLFKRVFGDGKLPPAIRAELIDERILHQTEGIRVVHRFHGHIPGLHARRYSNGTVGGFAVTERRVIGWMTPWPRAIDIAFGVAPGDTTTLTLAPDGLHVAWDLEQVHPKFGGTMSLHFEDGIADASLAQFPATTITRTSDPEHVARFAGLRQPLNL